jgi:hypothetical protein
MPAQAGVAAHTGVCYDGSMTTTGRAEDGPAKPFRVTPQDLLLDLGMLGLGVALTLRGSVSFGAIIMVGGVVALGRDISERAQRVTARLPLAPAFFAALSVDALVAMGFDVSAGAAGWIVTNGAAALFWGALAIREWFHFRRRNSVSRAS